MNINKIILFCILQTIVNCLIGQVKTKTIDTLSIYKNKTGVGYNVYEHEWFMKFGSWSYRAEKMTKQDSIVLLDSSSHYFKIFNKKNKIVMEGLKAKSGAFLGDVKYYKNDEYLYKIEKWNSQNCIDALGESLCDTDAPTAVRTIYFNKRGSISKISFYNVKITNKTPLSYKFFKQTLYY